MEWTDEEKQARFLERQIKMAKAGKGEEEERETEFTELKRENEEEKVS